MNTDTIFSLFSCVFRLRPCVSEDLRILQPSEVPVQLKGGEIEFVVPKNWQIAPGVWRSETKTDKKPFCVSAYLTLKQCTAADMYELPIESVAFMLLLATECTISAHTPAVEDVYVPNRAYDRPSSDGSTTQHTGPPLVVCRAINPALRVHVA
ncbi:unnamed protein product [Schistocephalus solidus]|uniref:Uncharacterized protein n=1 Tax=Schistocephalus solidus TaxID=70667 RepID=A0A3P7BYJ8_SCHSO|nr:unnamed protein product [Schistocephalus solidus]